MMRGRVLVLLDTVRSPPLSARRHCGRPRCWPLLWAAFVYYKLSPYATHIRERLGTATELRGPTPRQLARGAQLWRGVGRRRRSRSVLSFRRFYLAFLPRVYARVTRTIRRYGYAWSRSAADMTRRNTARIETQYNARRKYSAPRGGSRKSRRNKVEWGDAPALRDWVTPHPACYSHTASSSKRAPCP